MDLSEPLSTMPKAELHAHLNGSLSATTLQKLMDLKEGSRMKPDQVAVDTAAATIRAGHNKTIDEIFQVFHVVHQLTDTPEAVHLAACDVIKDFAADQVRYLELRTTPRHVTGSMTQRQYLDAVVRAIDQCRTEEVPIVVKLLPSIDRSRGLDVARQVVDLTLSYALLRPDIVVGLDVSGKMTTSDLADFIPLLDQIRGAGLQLAVHAAEVRNDPETEAILRFGPDRIGHGTFIRANPNLLSLLKEKRIPLELCMTSNVLCQTVANYEDHHLKEAMEHDLQFTLSTDDKGVFGTTLTEEYVIAGTTFGLTLTQLWTISFRTLDFAFISPVQRLELQAIWNRWKGANMIQDSAN